MKDMLSGRHVPKLPPGWHRRLALALACPLWTICAAGAGGGIMVMLEYPLPWMLGSMAVLAVFSLSGIPAGFSPALRLPMTMVLGATLGSRLDTDSLSFFVEHPGVLVVFLLYILSVLFLGWFVLCRVFGCNRDDGYLAAMPGGLSDMVLAAEACGCDARRVAAIQGLRIFLAVTLLSAWIALGSRLQVIRGTAWPQDDPDFSLLFPVAGVCAAGAAANRLLPVPAGAIFWPMALGALWSQGPAGPLVLPDWLVIAAQIVVGGSIGLRFRGYGWKEMFLRLGEALSLVAGMVLLLGLVLLFWALVAPELDRNILLLGHIPGGVSEMALLAATLHVEAGAVVLHHILRIFTIVLCHRPLFRLVTGGNPGQRR